MRTFAFVAFVLATACPAPLPPAPPPKLAHQPPAPPDAAIVGPAVVETAEPKLRLPRNFTPTRYVARLSIDPAKPTFDGSITISGTVSERSPVIWLHGEHLTVQHAAADNGASTSTLAVTPHGTDLLELRAEPALEPGAWQLAIDYSGVIDDVNTTGVFRETSASLPYVFSQFEALYARRAFPCLDEPDSKVPWKLTLEVPKGQLAVSNTNVETDTPFGDGRHRFEFAQTKPLPPYLIAFGVGPFDVVPAGSTKSGVPIRIITLKGRGAEAAYPAKTAAHVIDLLEAWFGAPYPYPKLDFLTIPLTAGFSAMENAGLITAAEYYTNLDAHPSWDRRKEWIRTVAHEGAHQWFGDLVTTSWWDEIWLNEGFANWMENKITSQFEPAWHAEVEELDLRLRALGADSVVSARQIRQPIAVPGDILNAFDGITYNKGASVLNMFEAYVGRDLFQQGVRAYLVAHGDGNATSKDFIAAISKVANKDLAPAFATFLDQPGAPELEASLVCAGGQARVELAQHRFVVSGTGSTATRPWILPICVAYDRDGKRAEACTQLDGTTGSLSLDTKTCPRWVMPNVSGRGYFFTRFTAAQVASLRDEAWPQISETERRAMFHDVVQAVRYRRDTGPAKLPLVLALSLVPKLLNINDRFAVADALGLPGLVDPFVAEDQRAKSEAWYRITFGPGAARLGVTAKPGDDLDAETMRVSLFEAAAWHGRDPELVRQAVELAKTWRELPQATREPVLTIAVDASAEVFDRVRSELKTEANRDHRGDMIAALAAVRDPKRYTTVLSLVLDPALDVRETYEIFSTSSETTRKLAEAFYRAHEAEIDQHMPKDEITGGMYVAMSLFTRACDAARRDEIASYLATHFGTRPGGERTVRQFTERLDQCIAMRATLEPEIRGWLGGVKVPRPPPATPTKKNK